MNVQHKPGTAAEPVQGCEYCALMQKEARHAQYRFWHMQTEHGLLEAIHDGEPESGFYRANRKDKTSAPVAYWFADGKLVCKLGTEFVDETRARAMWSYVAHKAVKHAAYKQKLDTGTWPGESETVSRQIDKENNPRAIIGGNNPPPDAFTEIKQQIEEMAREAEKLMKAGAAKTKEEADQAADVAQRLSDLWGQFDALRKAEKKPHDDAAKAVQEKYLPTLNTADVFKQLKNTVIAPYLYEIRRQEEAARREALKASEPPPATPARSTTTAGSRGRKTALKMQKFGVIEDRAAMIAALADTDAMTAFLNAQMANYIKANVPLAGMKIEERPVAQ